MSSIMKKSNLLPVETPGASQEGTLVIEQFLMTNYRFRRNILNGKVEFAVLPKADNKAEGNTNNRHPLKDATGSRRYICILIPDGQMIDNTGEIDYGQLYAQVTYELLEKKAPYWFNNEEVARIQQLNQDFMEQKDIGEMFVACFRKPNEGETFKTMNCNQMIGVMQGDYPTLQNTIGNRVRLGRFVSSLGFNFKDHSHVPFYEVVPLRAA